MNPRWFLLLALLPSSVVSAQIILPKILSTHMVVQRDLPVHVWGTAAPGEGISVAFRGETRVATASQLGQWSVYLKPGAAGGPFDMTIRGTLPGAAQSPDAAQNITIGDILVGDVWCVFRSKWAGDSIRCGPLIPV